MNFQLSKENSYYQQNSSNRKIAKKYCTKTLTNLCSSVSLTSKKALYSNERFQRLKKLRKITTKMPINFKFGLQFEASLYFSGSK